MNSTEWLKKDNEGATRLDESRLSLGIGINMLLLQLPEIGYAASPEAFNVALIKPGCHIHRAHRNDLRTTG